MSRTSDDAVQSYDIFKRLSDGRAVWICEVTTVLEAKDCVRDLERNDPAEYYVCNLADKQVLGTATPHWPELHVGQGDPAFFH